MKKEQDYTPIRFIGKSIEVSFLKDPYRKKIPHAPSCFVWEDRQYRVVGVINEWVDYRRKGPMAHNMQPHNLAKTVRRGSWGVGRFYFRVETDDGAIFDLYYDRAPKDIGNRLGGWFLWRELKKTGIQE